MISREIGPKSCGSTRGRLADRHTRPPATCAPRYPVRRVLSQAGIVVAQQYARPSMLDPYVAFIQETFTRFATLRASRLYQMLRARGYAGGPDHFRHIVAGYRPRPSAEAYLRLRTLQGGAGTR